MLETQDGAYANAPARSLVKPACWQAALGLFFCVLSNAANPASAFNLDREKRFANEVIAHLVAGDAVTISPAPGAPATCHSLFGFVHRWQTRFTGQHQRGLLTNPHRQPITLPWNNSCQLTGIASEPTLLKETSHEDHQ